VLLLLVMGFVFISLLVAGAAMAFGSCATRSPTPCAVGPTMLPFSGGMLSPYPNLRVLQVAMLVR